METPKQLFKSNSIDSVVDTFHPDEEVCELAYTRDDGIGIVTPDGEKEHIEWPVAKDRFTPASQHCSA